MPAVKVKREIKGAKEVELGGRVDERGRKRFMFGIIFLLKSSGSRSFCSGRSCIVRGDVG